jgi:hypothetical protein
MAKFKLDHVSGEIVHWDIHEFRADSENRVLSFAVEYDSGKVEHFYLASTEKKGSVSASIVTKGSAFVSGAGLGAKLGTPYGTFGMATGALLGLIASAVLENVFFHDNEREYFYYSYETGNKSFEGPVVLKSISA